MITQVQQNQEQSKTTEKKKPSHNHHKLGNSQMRMHLNDGKTENAQLPEAKSSEYPSDEIQMMKRNSEK